MQNFEQYLEKLFSDPGFAMFFGLVSLWYSFYLYRRPQRQGGLLFMTMSNWEKKSPRDTIFVIINNSTKDVTRNDMLNNSPLKVVFDDNLTVFDFIVTYNSFEKGKINLLQSSRNEYELDFDIIKRQQAIVLIATHDSKKRMQETWTEIQMEGILIDVEIERDDFSDQMISRARSVEFEAAIGSALLAIFISFSVRAFLKPLEINLPYRYLFAGSLLVCFIPVYHYFSGRVGHNDYRRFWKVLKKSRKK